MRFPPIWPNECKECRAGTINWRWRQSECVACPSEGVECADKVAINVWPGFYRPDDDIPVPYPCTMGAHACRGGIIGGQPSCHEGYVGPLCGLCAGGANARDTNATTADGSSSSSSSSNASATNSSAADLLSRQLTLGYFRNGEHCVACPQHGSALAWAICTILGLSLLWCWYYAFVVAGIHPLGVLTAALADVTIDAALRLATQLNMPSARAALERRQLALDRPRCKPWM